MDLIREKPHEAGAALLDVGAFGARQHSSAGSDQTGACVPCCCSTWGGSMTDLCLTLAHSSYLKA